MRKLFCLIGLALMFILTACGEAATTPAATDKPTEEPEPYAIINVFASPSVTDALNTITARYNTIHPNTAVIVTADSADELMRQLENGEVCDIVISSDSAVAALCENGLASVDSVLALAESKTAQFSIALTAAGSETRQSAAQEFLEYISSPASESAFSAKELQMR